MNRGAPSFFIHRTEGGATADAEDHPTIDEQVDTGHEHPRKTTRDDNEEGDREPVRFNQGEIDAVLLNEEAPPVRAPATAQANGMRRTRGQSTPGKNARRRAG